MIVAVSLAIYLNKVVNNLSILETNENKRTKACACAVGHKKI